MFAGEGGGGILKGAFQILISLLKGDDSFRLFSRSMPFLSYYYFSTSKNLLISRSKLVHAIVVVSVPSQIKSNDFAELKIILRICF